MTALVAGLDLGQTNDPTALAILEGSVHRSPETGRPALGYAVRHLQRWRLGTSYPDIVSDVLQMMARLPLAPAAPIVVDGTGVGRAVVDMFRALGPRLVPATIHGGQQTTRDPATSYWAVPKRELVGVVQVLLQGHRLKIASTLPEAPTLVHELEAFRARISAAGHDSYGAGATPDDWRTGVHDDLVLAVALACWYAERVPKPQPFRAEVGGQRTWGEGAARRGEVDWRIQEAVQSARIAEQMATARAAGWLTPGTLSR